MTTCLNSRKAHQDWERSNLAFRQRSVLRHGSHSQKRIMERISQKTGRDSLKLQTSEKVRELNALVAGWGNYFSLGPVSKAYRAVDAHCRYRLRQWLCAKHQHQGT